MHPLSEGRPRQSERNEEASGLASRTWIYGDDVNTDVIFPGKYTYTVTDPAEMAEHALEDLDPDFSKNVKPGDIIAAGKNFGCGSSREQAAFALKHAGVSFIIAASFARIFFRNTINAGLPAVEHPQAARAIKQDSDVKLDLVSGELYVDGAGFRFAPFPTRIMDILSAGGLVNYVKTTLLRARNTKAR
ncbi:3-isopropylmalate dehydratase [bacterium]|nr:3-isopropylmalate dehydratase [bacterium]